MTTRPKRAFLSLRSMMVMVTAASLLVSANLMNRTPDSRVGCRGVPLTYLVWTERCIVPKEEISRFLSELRTQGLWEDRGPVLTFALPKYQGVIDNATFYMGPASVQGVNFDSLSKLDKVNLVLDLVIALGVPVLLVNGG